MAGLGRNSDSYLKHVSQKQQLRTQKVVNSLSPLCIKVMKTFNYLGMCVYVCVHTYLDRCAFIIVSMKKIQQEFDKDTDPIHIQRPSGSVAGSSHWCSCSGNSLCKKIFSTNLDIQSCMNHINSFTHFSHPLRMMKALGKYPLNHSFSIICCLRFHHSSSHHLCLTQQVQGFSSRSHICSITLKPFFQQPGSSCSGAKTDERQKHVAFTKSVHLGGCKMMQPSQFFQRINRH